MARRLTYNKLVRDRIPEIIRSSNQEPKFRTLNDQDFATELRRKFLEEVQEYLAEPALEELADILELLHALAGLHQASPEKLERIRQEKAERRGAFTEKIFLEYAEPNK